MNKAVNLHCDHILGLSPLQRGLMGDFPKVLTVARPHHSPLQRAFLFTAMKNEVWKDAKGYEGFYQVSSLGRVRSTERTAWNSSGNRSVKERILKQSKGSIKYLRVNLSLNGKTTVHTVHRLVCSAFHPNPTNKRTINHINSDKTDNRAENLEWATHTENMRHYIKSISK